MGGGATGDGGAAAWLVITNPLLARLGSVDICESANSESGWHGIIRPETGTNRVDIHGSVNSRTWQQRLNECGVILDYAPHLAAARPITGSRNNFGKTYWRIRQYWKIFHYLTEVRQVWVVARSSAARAAATAARSSSSAGSVVSTGAAPVRSKGAWIWAW